MNLGVWLIYILSSAVVLLVWFHFIRAIKPEWLKDLLLLVPLAILITPTLVSGRHVAPAVAGLALDIVSHGMKGLYPNGPVLLVGILVAVFAAFFPTLKARLLKEQST